MKVELTKEELVTLADWYSCMVGKYFNQEKDNILNSKIENILKELTNEDIGDDGNGYNESGESD